MAEREECAGIFREPGFARVAASGKGKKAGEAFPRSLTDLA